MFEGLLEKVYRMVDDVAAQSGRVTKRGVISNTKVICIFDEHVHIFSHKLGRLHRIMIQTRITQSQRLWDVHNLWFKSSTPKNPGFSAIGAVHSTTYYLTYLRLRFI